VDLERLEARRQECKDRTGNGNGFGLTLGQAVALNVQGWATPSIRDWKDTPGMATAGTNPDGSERSRLDQLPRQAAQALGPTSSSSPAGTKNRGALDPAFARWLMGFPVAWDEASPGWREWQRAQAAIASGG
jgi:hypothetical protein